MSEVYDDTDEVVAQMVGDSGVIVEVAEGIAELARTYAERHTAQSWDDEQAPHFASQIKVIPAAGGKDALVINTDPLAVPKELGHILITPNSDKVGYVHGQYSMRNASLDYKGI
jgi:hypothetical protein